MADRGVRSAGGAVPRATAVDVDPDVRPRVCAVVGSYRFFEFAAAREERRAHCGAVLTEHRLIREHGFAYSAGYSDQNPTYDKVAADEIHACMGNFLGVVGYAPSSMRHRRCLAGPTPSTATSPRNCRSSPRNTSRRCGRSRSFRHPTPRRCRRTRGRWPPCTAPDGAIRGRGWACTRVARGAP